MSTVITPVSRVARIAVFMRARSLKSSVVLLAASVFAMGYNVQHAPAGDPPVAEHDQQSDAWIKALQQQLAAFPSWKTGHGLVFTMGDVLFVGGKAEVKPEARRYLAPLIAFVQKDQEHDIEIEGHTDNVGTVLSNIGLSQRRADAVEKLFVQNGIMPTRIRTFAYGESYPTASNDTERGRQQNRRVQVILTHKGENCSFRTSLYSNSPDRIPPWQKNHEGGK